MTGEEGVEAVPVPDRPDDLAEAFRPFEEEEIEVLRGFVEDVRKLGGMRFYSQVSGKITLKSKRGGPLVAETTEPDDEALRAALTLFRQLYSHGEPGSFNTVLNLLKNNVSDRDGKERDAAMRYLKDFKFVGKELIRRGIGVGLTIDDRSFSAREIIDLYLHGKYLHGRNEKGKVVSTLDQIPAIPRHTLYVTVHKLTHLYWTLANLVDLLLDDVRLVSSGS